MNNFNRQFFSRLRIIFMHISLFAAIPLYSQYTPEIDSLFKLLDKAGSDTNRVDLLLTLVEKLRRSDYDRAMAFYEEAYQLTRDLNWQKGIALSHIRKGQLNSAGNNIPGAQEEYLKALEIYRELNDQNGIADACIKAGITYGMQSEYHKAAEYFLRSLEANEKIGDKKRISDNYNNIGHCYKYLGDYEEALNYYDKSLEICEELKDSAGIAMMYNHIAIIHDYQGNYKKALDYYFKSLRINEQLGIEEEIGAACGNIGIVLYYLEDYDQALEYQKRNLEMMQKTGERRGEGIAYFNIGNIYERQGKYDLALENIDKGTQLMIETGDRQGIADGYLNLGVIYDKQGRNPLAIEMFEKGLALSNEIGYKLGVAQNNVNLGTIYYKSGNINLARSYLEQARTMGSELGYPEVIRGSAEWLSKVYAALNDYQRAYRYKLLYEEMDDSLTNAENVKKMTRMEMQYDFDKQQQEMAFEQEQERLRDQEEIKRQKIVKTSFIVGFCLVALLAFFILRSYYHKKKANELLAEQKEEIQAMNDMLKDSLDEKEVLLKEIHHRVKNNLQIISSLLNLQSHNIEDHTVKGAVMEGQSRVKSMALIHQVLYQSDRLSKINFQEYLEHLVHFLSSSFMPVDKKIVTKVEADNTHLDIDTAIPLGLIVNELVSNAFKYAFREMDKGELRVELKQHDGEGYKLRVSDNGTGLPENLDINQTSSLGLKLVNILTRQLEGELKISNKNGTVFEIRFKETIKKV
jgi:two-component sensor histidine kinase/tetratricopeptide (TPR) repeat protein